MIFVMLLAGVEKLINFAIQSDKLTQLGLEPLSGKSIRLIMTTPNIQVDTVFNEDSIRFEPVKQIGLFEAQEHISYLSPDCSVIVDSPVELLNLIRSPEGNLPIEGDYKVLMQVRELIAGFDPDIASQLEPFIGIALASQLTQVLQQLQTNVTHTAKHKLNEVADWASDITGHGKEDPADKAEFHSLNQQLLKLRADVEREQARLEAIKMEQARLREANHQ